MVQNNTAFDVQAVRKDERFDDFGMPTCRVFEVLMKKGLTKPLENYEPFNKKVELDATKFCKYHKYIGHTTDNCIQLKRAIQRLIAEGKIEKP